MTPQKLRPGIWGQRDSSKEDNVLPCFLTIIRKTKEGFEKTRKIPLCESKRRVKDVPSLKNMILFSFQPPMKPKF